MICLVVVEKESLPGKKRGWRQRIFPDLVKQDFEIVRIKKFKKRFAGVFNTHDLIHKQQQKSAKTATQRSTLGLLLIHKSNASCQHSLGVVLSKNQTARLAVTFQHTMVSMKKTVTATGKTTCAFHLNLLLIKPLVSFVSW